MPLTPGQIETIVIFINRLIAGSGYVVVMVQPAVSIGLGLPTLRRKGKLMANFELPNDEVATIAILTRDAAGDVVPPPAGDTFSVTSGLPGSLAATMPSPTSIRLQPLVQASPAIPVTVSDKNGLVAFTLVVDIVQDTTPTNIVLDVADATFTAQPVPTAPGP